MTMNYTKSLKKIKLIIWLLKIQLIQSFLNYYWIDLDKLISVINYLEINILYITGTYLLENAKSLAIIKDKKRFLKIFQLFITLLNYL